MTEKTLLVNPTPEVWSAHLNLLQAALARCPSYTPPHR